MEGIQSSVGAVQGAGYLGTFQKPAKSWLHVAQGLASPLEHPETCWIPQSFPRKEGENPHGVSGGGPFGIRGKRVMLEDTAAGMCSDLRCVQVQDCFF